MTASSAPTSTVSSSLTVIESSVPLTGAGISVSTLSVETSSSGSSAVTWSPTDLSQRVTVPSVTLSPSAGIVTGVPSPPPEALSSEADAGSGWGASSAAGCSGSGAGACSAGASSAAGAVSAAGEPPPPPSPPPMTASSAPTSPGSSSATRVFGSTPPAGGGGAAAPAVPPTDDGQLGTDLHGLVLGHEDLGQHARGGRRDLGVDLVGRDLEEGLVDLDLLALLLEPAGDRALGDALAQGGHGDGRRHRGSAPSGVGGGEVRTVSRARAGACRRGPGAPRPAPRSASGAGG